MIRLLLCFGAGLLSDLLVTGYYICVSRGRVAVASALSFPIAMVQFWIMQSVLLTGAGWPGAVAYSAGNSVGCFAIMKVLPLVEARR